MIIPNPLTSLVLDTPAEKLDALSDTRLTLLDRDGDTVYRDVPIGTTSRQHAQTCQLAGYTVVAVQRRNAFVRF